MTVQYDKMLYLIEDNETVEEPSASILMPGIIPTGHKDRLNGVLLPYSTYDRLSEAEPVAIVDNKDLAMC